MRILLVSGSLTPDPCGVGDYTHRLADALGRQPNVEVAVLTSATGGGAGPDPSWAYTVMRAVRGWTTTDIGRLYHAIRSWRPDVVHVQAPTQGYAGGWLAALVAPIAAVAGAKVVRTWHEGFGRDQALRLLADTLAPGPHIVVRPDFDRYVSRILRPLIARRDRFLIRSASAIPRSTLGSQALARHRALLLDGAQRLLVCFGFLYPSKGAEDVFRFADPVTDRILIIGEDGVDPDYTEKVRRLADSPPWQGRAAVTGNLPADQVADAIAAADAVVLPLRTGGGVWNSAIHAAVEQGTPVVTTTSDAEQAAVDGLVRYVALGDESGFAAAVRDLPPWRGDRAGVGDDPWERIAREHRAVYATVLGDPQ